MLSLKRCTSEWLCESPIGRLGTAGGASSSSGIRRGGSTGWTPLCADWSCTPRRYSLPSCKPLLLPLAAALHNHWSETALRVGYSARNAAAAPRRGPRSLRPGQSPSPLSNPRRPKESRGAAVPSGNRYLHKTIVISILVWFSNDIPVCRFSTVNDY